MLAILKAGAAYLPLDPSYPKERLDFVSQDAQALLLLSHSSLGDRLQSPASKTIYLDDVWDQVTQLPSSLPASEVCADNLAYVIYTSGSTGRPKGVMVTHAGLCNLASAQAEGFAVNEDSRVLQFASMSFDASVSEIMVTLAAGARLHLMHASDTVHDLGRLLQREAISVVTLPPSVLPLLEEHELASLKTLIVAGETCPIQWAAWGAERFKFINAYGPTETTVCASMYEYKGGDCVAIGRPLSNLRTYVLDERMQPVGIGVVGELYIAGVALARGYLGRAALTAERFVPNPYAEGERLYRTGDRARYLQDGNLAYLGRVDRQVKLRGYRIELEEIEAVTRAHPAVAHVAVAVLEHRPGDSRLVAYVVSHSGESIDAKQLQSYVEERVPGYMVPSAIVSLDVLPLGPNGKINYSALPAPAKWGHTVVGEFVAPTSNTEIVAAAIWTKALGVARIDRRDDFFALGGHSLLATRVVADVQRMFDVDIPLRLLFTASSLGEFASEIDSARAHKRCVARPRLTAHDRPSEIPLSFAQERLWFVEQLGLSGWTYNTPMAYRLEGRLQIAALEHAFSELLKRHEILRTRIVSAQGHAHQVIAEAGEFHIRVTDVSGLAQSARQLQAERLMQQDVQRVFELQSEPLLRVLLLRLSEQEHLLQMTLHHIVFDGWSAAVMMRELSELYAAQVEGRQARLEPLRVQYADYALWQRQWLSGTALQEQLGYWKEQLQGVPSALELPTDYRRPAVASFKGSVLRFELSAKLHAGLSALAGKEGATLYMVLLAAFQVLLWRWSGARDVVVGSPIAGRTERELEPLIGLFVNTLLMRAQLREGTSFRALLRSVRQTALEAYAHQEVPFEKLVAELQPQRDLSRQPLCQVVFNLQSDVLLQQASNARSLQWLPLAIAPTVSKVDLEMLLQETTAGMDGYFVYAADLFAAETIERICGYFKTLLESIVADADRGIDALPLMSAAQRDEVLRVWNATDAPIESCCIHQLISQQAQRSKDAIAVSCAQQTLSYEALEQRSNQLAHYLRRLGAGPETVVGLCLDRSIDVIVGMLAILKAGAAYLPLDPSYPMQRLEYMARDARISVLVTKSGVAHGLDALGVPQVKLDEEWARVRSEPSQPLSIDVDPQGLAYVIYTSGSTGQPKGVMVTHSGVMNLVAALSATIEITDQDAVFALAPFSFDMSVDDIFWPLSRGGRVILCPPLVAYDGVQLSEQLTQSGATLMQATPTTWRMLLDANWSCRGFKMICGGEALTEDFAQSLMQAGGQLWNWYGPTETTVTASSYRYASGRRISIGRPLSNVLFYLLNEWMEPVEIGVAGELFIGGAGVSRGYLGKARLTAERFVPSPYGCGERLYRTGDRARYLSDGNVEFLGRVDQQLKLRGYRIEIGEIETAIRRVPAVRNVVVLVQDDAVGGQSLIAYLEATSGHVQILEVWKSLKKLLPDYMVPSGYVLVDQLPRSPSGKIDTAQLTRLELQTFRTSPHEAPSTPIEEALAVIWGEVLRVQHVGVNDNFFDLGGHSLLAARIVARIREVLAMELPLQVLFRTPTIAGLAEFMIESTMSAA
jgi:amino acid adenylation domain-containing protein